MSEILKIQNLSAGYQDKPVIDNISFSVQEGEVLAVIGQNGCGKSTLLKTIARIISDNFGDIIFKNVNINSLKTWDLKRRGISYFMQGGMIFPTMTVNEHFDLALKGSDKEESKRLMEESLNYFPALSSSLNKRAGNLSGGQRQMLSFAMLISQQTQFWLLDEPTAGLAPEAVKKATNFLKKVKQLTNMTMIIVEHNYQVAFDLADHVAIIKEGKLYDSFPRLEFQKVDFLENHLFN